MAALKEAPDQERAARPDARWEGWGGERDGAGGVSGNGIRFVQAFSPTCIEALLPVPMAASTIRVNSST